MQVALDVGGRVRTVVITTEGERFLVTVDGHRWPVSAARIDAHSLSLIFGSNGGGGPSYEVTVAPALGTGGRIVHVGRAAVSVGAPGGRTISRKDDDALAKASSPQRVVAAMPGRVVRVLVSPGDAVRAGQGLVVIEAMKMENELRATRDGRVADVRVREAASVEAGALLVVIE
jgi:biotin carboxyl carrier protein